MIRNQPPPEHMYDLASGTVANATPSRFMDVVLLEKSVMQEGDSFHTR
jgi:hypothetical protein